MPHVSLAAQADPKAFREEFPDTLEEFWGPTLPEIVEQVGVSAEGTSIEDVAAYSDAIMSAKVPWVETWNRATGIKPPRWVLGSEA